MKVAESRLNNVKIAFRSKLRNTCAIPLYYHSKSCYNIINAKAAGLLAPRFLISLVRLMGISVRMEWNTVRRKDILILDIAFVMPRCILDDIEYTG